MLIPIIISVLFFFPMLLIFIKFILSKFKMSTRANLRRVLYNTEKTFLNLCRTSQYPITHRPRVVAVSKTKPIALIIDAYRAGQRHFGENYVQELFSKSKHPDILGKCKNIRWHFIGHLQKSNIPQLIQVPKLWMCETIDKEKTAEALNSKLDDHELAPLRVMVQVNTSGEESKHGCLPESCTDLVNFIIEECSNLEFTGLMTIGSVGHNVNECGDNPDFLRLIKCREEVCKDLGLEIGSVELSMGMSHDYEHAIELGSSNVRLGSMIFGERDVKKK